MMRSPALRLGLYIACLGVCGVQACGEDDIALSGSIGEQFSLEFDRLSIRKQGDALLLEYLKDLTGGSTNKVCKVVLETEGLEVRSGSRIAGATFLDRVTITRVAATGGDFPKVQAGSLELKTFVFEDGGAVQGAFEAVFVDSGRTLSGRFKGKISEVDLGI